MGRHSCCLKQKLRQGLWSPEEDEKLYNYMNRYGTKGCWSSVPKLAELQRCGKSCRLRWLNYLRPDLKRGTFSQDEEDLIINLHKLLGNRWAQIAAQLPGRTDNEIKNFWNSNLKKKLMKQGINPVTHKPLSVENPKKLEEKNPINESPQEQLLLRSNKAPLHSTSILRENEPRFLLFDAYSANDNGLMEASREIHGSAFDCVPLLEFQTSFGSNFYNQNLTSQYHPDSRFEMNPSFEFSSLPCLTSLDNLEFSGNSGSRLMSSSNSSTINNYNAAFDCLFQFQEVKSEDFEPNSSSWKDQEQQIYAHNSIDFSSYPFTSLSEDLTQTSFEVIFDHIELSPPPPCI